MTNKKNSSYLSFGSLLENTRKEVGLTRTSLAIMLDVNSKTVLRWERNESKPNEKMILKLNEVLNTDINSLLEEDFSLVISKESKIKKLIIGFNLLLLCLYGLVNGIYGVYYSIYLDVNGILDNISFLIPIEQKVIILLFYISFQAILIIILDIFFRIKIKI
ncbi:MAG: helix-turn-helix domain-containing protein [Anaeroplasma sp.]